MSEKLTLEERVWRLENLFRATWGSLDVKDQEDFLIDANRQVKALNERLSQRTSDKRMEGDQ